MKKLDGRKHPVNISILEVLLYLNMLDTCPVYTCPFAKLKNRKKPTKTKLYIAELVTTQHNLHKDSVRIFSNPEWLIRYFRLARRLAIETAIDRVDHTGQDIVQEILQHLIHYIK